MMKKIHKGSLLVAGLLVLDFFLPRFAVAGSTEELVGALCSKIMTCAENNPQFRRKLKVKSPMVCSDNLSGATGMLLWGNFGLTGHERQLKAADVEAMVSTGTVLVAKNNLAQCVEEINSLDCGIVTDNLREGLAYTPNLVSEKGICPKVYKDVLPSTTTAGQIIESICNTYANCQKGVFSFDSAKEMCTEELNGPSGKSLWRDFGSRKLRDRFTAAQIESQIGAKAINVDVEALNDCRQEKISKISCDDFGRYVTAGYWGDIDKALGRKAPCKYVLSIARRAR